MVVEDTFLIPWLQINEVSIQPLFDGQKLSFEVPEESVGLISEFYTGNPQVYLREYVTRLKQVRGLLFSLRSRESGKENGRYNRNGKERNFR